MTCTPSSPTQNTTTVSSVIERFVRKNESYYHPCDQHLLQGFIVKKHLPPHTKVFAIGDLHGQSGSLSAIFSFFKQKGYLSPSWKLPEVNPKPFFAIFLGDILDVRVPGLDIPSYPPFAYLLNMMNNYPDNFSVLRGNHESLDFLPPLRATEDAELFSRHSFLWERVFTYLPLSLSISGNNPLEKNRNSSTFLMDYLVPEFTYVIFMQLILRPQHHRFTRIIFKMLYLVFQEKISFHSCIKKLS